jgi:small ligand-binding sensory domain FIST
LVLLADADSFDVPSWLAAQNPQLPIAGARFGGPIRTRRERRQGEVRSDDALPAPAALPASNVVYRNGTKSVGGALAVAFGPEFTFRTLVSQNCRPIGQPFTVTKAERNVVYAMGGHLATAALDLTVETCDDNERMLLRQGIHLGVVVNAGVGLRRVEVDRHDAGSEVSTQFISALTVGDQDEALLAGAEPNGFGIGDFVVHQVLGADRNAGAIAVAGSCEVGDIVQFQVTDAAAARSECLQVLAEALDLNGPMPSHHSTVGALLFPSVSRGTNFFGTEHHDAAAVAEFSTACSAGAFCAIQLGPLGDVTGQHQNSLTIALVHAAPPRGAWSDV